MCACVCVCVCDAREKQPYNDLNLGLLHNNHLNMSLVTGPQLDGHVYMCVWKRARETEILEVHILVIYFGIQ